MRVLVTGAAGFIGFHLCVKLLKLGHEVVGLDNINGYYDIKLKMARLKELGIEEVFEHKLSESTIYNSQFQFIKISLEDQIHLPQLFQKFEFDAVCNLAAQAGVRYSIEDPMVYAESNIIGFLNLLECMRNFMVKKFVFASSSSVYGNSKNVPFSTKDKVDEPISLYAASKKANELMAYTYSHLFGIQTIGLRFFTVYGPWGRPDMAMFLFTDAIFNEKPIKVFNQGELYRDFTYIDDIVNGVVATLTQNNEKNYEIYNIGNGNPVKLTDFIDAIEVETNLKFTKEMYPMQPGDVERTWADTSEFEKEYNYKPSVSVPSGIKEFVSWYKMYYSTHK
jgi:UDP-glucuronate 4-epimerase